MRITLLLISLYAAMIATSSLAQSLSSGSSTFDRLAKEGKTGQLANPVFEDRTEMLQFARDCAQVVKELSSLPMLTAEQSRIRNDAFLASEFMTGDVYLLATSDISSVVKLRESVKIPPAPGFIYVKKYPSTNAMPPLLADVFVRLSSGGESTVKGVTIRGRYIALLETEYRDEVEDNLAHEMVHAYLTTACPAELPEWFQEGAAVYFSLGKPTKLYGKTGDPNVVAMSVPEGYRRKLYNFQYIEDEIGKEGLYKFIRESVATGHVDARKALGLPPIAEKERATSPAAPIAIAIGLVASLIIVWFFAIRREEWAD